MHSYVSRISSINDSPELTVFCSNKVFSNVVFNDYCCFAEVINFCTFKVISSNYNMR